MTSGQLIPVTLASTNFASFGVDAIPISNTTKLLQDVPVLDPNSSLIELDDKDNTYDTINQEPDTSNEEELNQKIRERVQKQIESIKGLEKLEESSQTRSNIVRQEQQINDEFTVIKNGEEIDI